MIVIAIEARDEPIGVRAHKLYVFSAAVMGLILSSAWLTYIYCCTCKCRDGRIDLFRKLGRRRIVFV